MKFSSCSICFLAYPVKKTVIVDGKRVCNKCKKEKKTNVKEEK